ncbi:MAG: hypothetical protein IT442_05380 [Phycisphaeraceae bacterium]|nr:hypothetical protein [Phycisphaeraceae bacterium]
MSTILDIADAVTAELNSPTSPLASQVVAQRHYKPTFDLKELKDLRVVVVPKAVENTGATRTLMQMDVQIDVGVLKKLGDDPVAEADELMTLVEAIAAYLRSRPLAGVPGAAWVRCENTPIYAPDHLEQLRQFTSVLTLTYRVLR